MGDHERTPHNKYDVISMKTNFVLIRFGGTFRTLHFDKQSFLNTISSFTPYWYYKPTNAIHADSPRAYTSENILYLSTKDKSHLQCNGNDGSVVNGLRQPILHSFVLNKAPRCKVFSQPETTHFKKTFKCVLNAIKFYLEDDNHEKVNFNGETLTFNLQIFKISTIKGPFKTLNPIDIALVKNITLVQKTLLVR